jgi:predicted ATP-grasp superfamily ATP-dependent carboligase
VAWRAVLAAAVSAAGGQSAARLEHVATCPVLLQSFVPGTDFRVHVVGDEVYATEITTTPSTTATPAATAALER